MLSRSPKLLLGLILLSACAPGVGTQVPANTMPDANTHAKFFAIASGAKHALGSDNPAIACSSCHTAGSATFKDFDCLSCHAHADQAALVAGHRGVPNFVYASPNCYACHPQGTASGALPTGLVSDATRSITVTAQIATWSGTSITSFTPQSEILPMQMDHASKQLSPAALSSCGNCHTNAASLFPGNLHGSLAALGLPQPTACSDCHTAALPTGFVGPTATNPARTPPSGEMKHDAVLWVSGKAGTASAVPQDCSSCHVAPATTAATWASSKSTGNAALFHPSLGAAQPGSCIDCHANSRPASVVTVAPLGVQYDHTAPEAMGDCASCHAQASTAGNFAAWSGGQFHLASSAAPASCLPCHSAERPTSSAGWRGSFAGSPFDYGTNTLGITHGAGEDCASCHKGPGTGAWGGTQNWEAGHFAHGAGTLSETACINCHTTQRPDLQNPPLAVQTATGSFDHSTNGAADCFGCHQATVSSGSYLNYYKPGTVQAGGDWQGGVAYPGATPIGSLSQKVTVTEYALSRSGTNNFITGITSTQATLFNQMLHTSSAIPALVAPGTSPGGDLNTCWHCHTSSGTTVTSFANGQFHSALDTYTASPGGTVSKLPQPTVCLDCHKQMRPANIVEKVVSNAGSDVQAMDHNATFANAVTINNASVTSVAQLDCTACHASPGSTWTDGAFHIKISSGNSAASLGDCTACHYPLMADTAKSTGTLGGTNFVNFKMVHASAQLTSQQCQLCHTSAVGNTSGSVPQIDPTKFQTGTLHATVTTQPTACLECHAASAPKAKASTQSSVSYTFAGGGGSATNSRQFMNHGSSDAAGDCAACHLADARPSSPVWSTSTAYHVAVPKPVTCQQCHGLQNGSSAAGTGNNLPNGLSNSSTATSASSDTTTGIAPGTLDQIIHTDVNVTAHDCNFCHTQVGPSTVAAIKGKEWAQASFHSHFTSGTALTMNGTTGRCSNCHLNVRPLAAGFSTNHSGFTDVSGSQDCSACHAYPGTGTAASPNWMGGGAPSFITLGGFTIPQPPAASAGLVQTVTTNVPHPGVTGTVTCASCHTGGVGGKGAIGYDHASSVASASCNSCHEAGSNLLSPVWNGVTAQGSGAGDTRPTTLVNLNTGGCTLASTALGEGYHFYKQAGAGPTGADCSGCHRAPAGVAVATTGSAFTNAWRFSHPPKNGSSQNDSPCLYCHANGCGN